MRSFIRERLITVIILSWFTVMVLLVWWLLPAHAQEKPVTTRPLNVVSNNASTTVTVTNTFQQALARPTATPGRSGCTIINYGSNTMWVFEDSTAAGLPAANVSVTATKAKSVQLAANQGYYCTSGGVTISSAIFITGTSGDAFYAAQQ